MTVVPPTPFWHEEVPQRMVIVTMQRRLDNPRPPLRHARILYGEMLCDETGQLYERIGDNIRRLNHLIGGPSGELLDMDPSASWTAPVQGHDPDVIDGEIEVDDEPVRSSSPNSDAAVRLLLPPGTRRVVQFGDVRTIVESQLARPDRLRSVHRLPCFIQVVEAVRTQHVSALAPLQPNGEPGRAAIERLTPSLGAIFAVASLVRPSKSHGAVPSDTARAGERFILIQLASDPTAAMTPRSPSEQGPPSADPPKVTIPAACLRAWEFVRSREEAEYDAASDASRGWCGRTVEAIRRVVCDRAAYRRWHALLSGRTTDEQLWMVKPPAHSMSNPAVRAWAGAVLASAGYDGTSMMREWEIFWRRKGV